MFKQTYTFDHRKKESDRVWKKFPLKTPIVIELKDVDTKNTELKKKYLVESNCTVQWFQNVIREQFRLSTQEGIHMIVNNTVIPKYNMLISEVYELYKDEDGFLYILWFAHTQCTSCVPHYGRRRFESKNLLWWV